VRRCRHGDRETCRRVTSRGGHLRLGEEQAPAQIRAPDVGTAQVGAQQIGRAEIHPAEVRPDEVGASKVRVAEVGRSTVDALPPGGISTPVGDVVVYRLPDRVLAYR